jgi:BMFP domain-containing protein YqiC
MNSDDFYNSLKSQLDQIMTGAESLNTEAQMHLRLAVSNLFEKLDVVSREEFDAQTAVLSRSREKIERLKEQLAELEKLVQDSD